MTKKNETKKKGKKTKSPITEGLVRKALTTQPLSCRQIAKKLGFEKYCNSVRVQRILRGPMKAEVKTQMVHNKGQIGRPYLGYFKK